MFTLIIDILYLLVGIYLIYAGITANKLVSDDLTNDDSIISNDKLFISQIIIGGIISLISGYKLYRLF